MAEARENDENFKSPLDLLFLQIEEGKRYIKREGSAPAAPQPSASLSRSFGSAAGGDSEYSWEPSLLERNSDHVRPADCGGLSPDEDFALMNYKQFKVAAGKTLKSIIISCNVRLAPIATAGVRKLLESDEMELDKLGDPDAKVAVFGILSDTDKTLSFLFAIMMWQCIDQLCRKALTDYGGKLPTPVHFIFDEFANIGTIPQIEETIAVTRSRNIGITIILQSMSQLESKYDKKAQTIVDCCDSTLFLGGKSNSTNKEIAEMIGKQTINQMTYNESRGQSPSASKNLQIQGRDLIDAAEIGKMSRKKAILLIAGTNPLMDDKFDPHTHKRYTDKDVATFMQKLLDALGLSTDDDEGTADVPVYDLSVEEAETRTTQTVRVYADGTYEVIDTTISTDEDGLTSAKVSNGGKVSYDALDEAQKRAVSDVAVIGDTGIVLNYSVTDGLPSSIDRDALKKLAEDNADLIEHLVFKTEKFNPDKYDGSVSMSFGFDSNAVIDRLDGQTKDIVVFELMAKDGDEGDGTAAPVLVASECDLDNEEQTVTLIPSVIGTTATDKSDGDHSLMAGKDAVITDHVTYENLIPGKEYTLKASLMDKETGELLSVNDQHVTAEMKFTPNSQNGTVDIDLGKFDASALDGHDLVVFEELYKQTSDGDAPVDVLVAEHKDLDDEGQTVSVTSSPLGGFFGKTGGNSFFATVAVAALVVLAGGCAVYGVKTRRKAKDGQTDTDHDGGKDEEA